jgi:hypothetical protein
MDVWVIASTKRRWNGMRMPDFGTRSGGSGLSRDGTRLVSNLLSFLICGAER